jgi:hypothetical protein
VLVVVRRHRVRRGVCLRRLHVVMRLRLRLLLRLLLVLVLVLLLLLLLLLQRLQVRHVLRGRGDLRSRVRRAALPASAWPIHEAAPASPRHAAAAAVDLGAIYRAV